MGLHQTFKFEAEDAKVREFLRSLSSAEKVDDRGEFFVFRELEGPSFEFDCEIIPEGLLSNRSGAYFWFLGVFVEKLTGQFGKIEVEDA